MNKLLKMTGVLAVLVAVLAFAGVSAALAQGPNAPDDAPLAGQARAQRGAGAGLNLMAVDEAAMHAAIADALGMPVAELEAALADGTTLAVLAQTQGVDLATVQAAMDAVHADALQAAVSEGLVSQEQADWMLSRRGGQNGQAGGAQGNGRGSGAGQGYGRGAGQAGGMGPGAGGNGFNGECPYVTP